MVGYFLDGEPAIFQTQPNVSKLREEHKDVRRMTDDELRGYMEQVTEHEL